MLRGASLVGMTVREARNYLLWIRGAWVGLGCKPVFGANIGNFCKKIKAADRPSQVITGMNQMPISGFAVFVPSRVITSLCAMYAKEAQDNDGAQANQRLDAVVRGILDNRCNAYVEAMNGLLQQAMRAARGFRMASHFFAIADLQMSKLKHLPSNPLLPATIQRADPPMQVNVKLQTNRHRAERK